MRCDEVFHSGGRPVAVLLEPEGEADEKGSLEAEGEEEPAPFMLRNEKETSRKSVMVANASQTRRFEVVAIG